MVRAQDEVLTPEIVKTLVEIRLLKSEIEVSRSRKDAYHYIFHVRRRAGLDASTESNMVRHFGNQVFLLKEELASKEGELPESMR